MQISGKSPWIGIALIAGAAVLMQGCAALAVATVAAGGGVGYAISQEPPESTASAAPAAGDETADPDSQPTAWSEPTDTSEPTPLVEPQAPVESVEVQPIQ